VQSPHRADSLDLGQEFIVARLGVGLLPANRPPADGVRLVLRRGVSGQLQRPMGGIVRRGVLAICGAAALLLAATSPAFAVSKNVEHVKALAASAARRGFRRPSTSSA
jgi:hypothetical protein